MRIGWKQRCVVRRKFKVVDSGFVYIKVIMKTLIVDEMAKGEERAREMKTEILKFKSVDK